MQNDSAIVRSSLGRILSLGALYDARKDALVGVKIFKQKPPNTSITCIDNPSSKVDFEITDRLSEKFNKLGVNAELKLSVLAGLVNLQGAGNYLREEKASAKAGRVTLLYSMTTKSESLNIFNEELKDTINLNAIDCVEATHVVVGIEWGANCTITAEYANQENEESTKVQGLLKAAINQVSYAINGQGETDYEYKNNEYTNNFSFRSNCDIVTTNAELPSNLQQAIAFVKTLPTLVRASNDGRGKPLLYTLLPLSSVIRYFQFERQIDLTLKQLQEEAILRFVQLFDAISLVRQELYDIHQEIQLNSFCLLEEDLQKVTVLQNNFAIAEAGLRSKLQKTLFEVRSGRSDASALDDLMKKFEESEFSTIKVRHNLQSFISLREKIKHVNILIKKGIDYIGKSDSLESKYLLDQNQEIYILYLAWSCKNNESWKANLQLFMSLLKTHELDKEKYNFIIVDSDLKAEFTKKDAAIVHYVDGQIRCEDLLNKNKADANLCLAQSNDIEDCNYPPNNRTPIKLRCPSSLNGGSCENSIHQWLCNKCREPLEYGFDGYFYCSCGKSKTTAFQYRCNSEKHGATFVYYPEGSLKNYLDTVRPLEEINILILGETGVGKSTWINGLANYFMYDSLEKAEKGELISVIPSSFTMTDNDYNERVITTGEDKNENFTAGQSATQHPVAYTLNCGDKIIRLIDTPGIGDTRGTEQDKKNFENILQFLSNHQEIHGICILLKPNNARLTVMFRFCIKELLTHLHRSAAQNIVFCFTNCRSTFYKPGDTLPALRTLLAENPDVEIPLAKHTIYCMDNESFRFLSALKNGIEFEEKDRQDYAASWNRSVEQTALLLKHIQTLKPHKVTDTLTLNDTRRIVISLSNPIAKISQNIQTNIALLKDHEKEITSFQGSIQDLQKLLYIPYSDLKRRNLDYPRTVCTADKCVEVISNDNGQKQIHYKTHCHEHCYLDGVATDVINNVALQNCSAMDSNKNCKVCGCSWNTHQHVTYELYTVVGKKIDSNIKQQINTKEEGKREKEKLIQGLNERSKKLKQEQEIITKASAKFACFLKQNAISAYNDGFADYLDMLIREEKNKINAGGNNKTLLGLEQMKRDYAEQVKILDDAIKQGGEQATITLHDIKKLEQQLFNLEINGKDLRDIMKTAAEGKARAVKYNERQLKTRNTKKSDGLVSDFANAVLDKGNALWNMINRQN